MNRVLSFRDLRLITELSHYSELDLLRPENDSMVMGYLAKLGFDVDFGVVYEPTKHRDMQGNVGVGFRAIGELDINRNVVNSYLCSMEDRLCVAAYLDPTFIMEIAPMLGSRIDPKSFMGEETNPEFDETLIEYTEPDFEEVSRLLDTLRSIRDSIRGPINDKEDNGTSDHV